MKLTGLHHVSAITAQAPRNLDFYTQTLGMRLVKKSVNQDDPGTYHLFYADEVGHPGTDLTFFPWTDMAPPRMGHGLATEVALEIPEGSLDFWVARLHQYSTKIDGVETRFGGRVVALVDPHGLRLALVEHGARGRSSHGLEVPSLPSDKCAVSSAHASPRRTARRRLGS